MLNHFFLIQNVFLESIFLCSKIKINLSISQQQLDPFSKYDIKNIFFKRDPILEDEILN